MRSTTKQHPPGPMPTVGPASPEPEAPAAVPPPDPGLPRASGLTLQEVERRHILRVMEEVSFQVETAASLLGIPRSTLYVKLKGYGIQTSRFQNPSPESGI